MRVPCGRLDLSITHTKEKFIILIQKRFNSERSTPSMPLSISEHAVPLGHAERLVEAW